MKKIMQYFDDFTFHARVMPVLVISIPIIILAIVKGIITGDFLSIGIYLFVTIVFLTFTSKVAREQGKRYEEKMYKNLGEKPTTIILRFSDSTIGKTSKIKYHEVLSKRTGFTLPLSVNEESEESDSDYGAAMDWLRNYANEHREKEFRVYQELKEYNFWRNLYGSRWIAILFYGLILLRECIIIKKFDVRVLFTQPYPQYVAILIMLASIISMVLFVNKLTVERKAFDYAKTLVEVCNRI